MMDCQLKGVDGLRAVQLWAGLRTQLCEYSLANKGFSSGMEADLLDETEVRIEAEIWRDVREGKGARVFLEEGQAPGMYWRMGLQSGRSRK